MEEFLNLVYAKANPPKEGIEVENCQVLGRAFGKDAKDARDKLVRNHPWIKECCFCRLKQLGL